MCVCFVVFGVCIDCCDYGCVVTYFKFLCEFFILYCDNVWLRVVYEFLVPRFFLWCRLF